MHNARQLTLAMLGLILLAASATAQESVAEPGPDEKLAQEQQQLAAKFRHLEEVLLRMAELNAATDPGRAALLKKAVAQSREKLIGTQFDTLVALLGKGQLSRAIENQDPLDKDLRALLELLLSENRSKRIEAEKARMRRYLKEVNRLIRRQKDVQGRTAGGDQPDRLAGEQARLGDDTGKLAGEIQQNEEPGAAEGKPNQGDGKNGKKPQEGKPGEQGSEGKPSEGEGSESEPSEPSESDSQGGKPSEGQGQPQQGQGQPRQGQGGGESESQPQPPQGEPPNPARKRLEAARQRMQEAEQKLQQAQRDGAVEKQEEALRELEQAKAELEEILRQLREEEIERMLAALEARFRRMLEMQREVYDGTVRLDKVPSERRGASHQIESRRLSGKEDEILTETDKALLLLRDDGTAVAFPEAVTQMRDDMVQVRLRLAQAKVGKMTQLIEEDIIAAMEEMIEAIKKAQEDLEQQQQQQQQDQPQGEMQDPPLVDALAEIKMIRALQMRVNRRTERYSKLVDGEQADQPELLEALRRLAERELRIYRVTRDLEMGKNQ